MMASKEEFLGSKPASSFLARTDRVIRNTLPITMRRGRTFRSRRTRPADGQSNNSETLSRIQSLADYTIDTLESSFQKRQGSHGTKPLELAEHYDVPIHLYSPRHEPLCVPFHVARARARMQCFGRSRECLGS